MIFLDSNSKPYDLNSEELVQLELFIESLHKRELQ